MPLNDDLDAVLKRIESGQQSEEDLVALCQILRGDARQEVLQKLAKYNVRVEELAGHDVQIGDRIFNLQVQSPKSDLNTDQEIIDSGEIPSCPYQGLSAFQEENAEFFFGREAFIEDVVREEGGVRQGLVNAVKTKSLVAVVGASGSGKSSLVFAGLLPQLAQESGWLICKLRPGYPDKRSFHNLAAALLSLKPAASNADPLVLLSQRAEALRAGTVTLQDVVAEMLRQTPTTRCLVLVLDQFEELFTLCAEEERQPLIDVLLAGVKDASGLKIVLTLRADFCGQAYAYRPLADALHEADLKLGPMNREELRSAIAQPAAKVGVQLEAGLVDRILDDVGQEPGNLPLLEFALTQLWAKQKQRQLTHQAYSEIGGVAKALANHAEAVYTQLNQIKQKQVQQIFLPLVRLGEGTEDTRRLATRAEVGNWELVTLLAGEKARLVVTGRNEQSEEETVEVVHEALIREWRRLRQWINENRDKLRQKSKIEMASEEWRERSKSKDYLLQGRQLTSARIFIREQANQLLLSSTALHFIQVSLQQHRWNALKLTSLMVVPATTIILTVELYSRETTVKQDYANLSTNNRSLQREAILSLLKGCRFQKDIAWISTYFRERLFGNCRPLTGQNLAKANLKFANLENVNLQDINLQEAALEKANLRSVNLQQANLQGANLQGADLQGANFRDANLKGANLQGANLQQIITQGANFQDANLQSTNLRNTHFRDANFKDSDFRDARLGNTRFWSSNLQGSNFQKVLFNGSDLATNLQGANLQGSDLRGTHLRGANLQDANLQDAILWNANLEGADLQRSNLQDVGLGDASLENANLQNADLRKAHLYKTNVQNANFRGTKFQNTVLHEVTFRRTNNVTIQQFGKARLCFVTLPDSSINNRDCDAIKTEMWRNAY